MTLRYTSKQNTNANFFNLTDNEYINYIIYIKNYHFEYFSFLK